MKKKLFYLLKEFIIIPIFLFVCVIIFCNFITIKSFNLQRNFLFNIQGNIYIYLKAFFISVLTLIVIEYFISFKQEDNHLVSRVFSLFTVVTLFMFVFNVFIIRFNVNILYISNLICIIFFQLFYLLYLKILKIKYPLILSSIIVILLTFIFKLFIY